MVKWLPSRVGVAALFLGLALLILVYDRSIYRSNAALELSGPARGEEQLSGGTAVQATVKELASKLERPQVAAARYEVAVDRNLFAEDRTAWQPPAPKLPEEPEKTEEEGAATLAPQRRDVVLFGTYLAGSKRKALLHFKRFRQGRRLLAEGDEAVDEEAGSSRRPGASYTLLRVEAKSVALKDDRGGEFVIGLYDNKQRRPVKTENQKSIQVEAAVVPPTVTAAPPDGGTAGQQNVTSAGEPALSAKQIRKMSVEEKDALVKSGDLIKHNTPFGPVYKRARKP